MRTILIFSALTVLTACTDINRPGGDRDSFGCLGSGGEQWSPEMQACIQHWNGRIELVHQGSGDPDYSAFVIVSEDEAEVFIPHENERITLVRDKTVTDVSVWYAPDADMFLVETEIGIYQLEDNGGFITYAQEPDLEPSDIDNIPEHSFDETSGEILAALGVVGKVEDGPYPQYTLHIELKDEPKDTVFNLIAEGAELNGADLSTLQGATVSIEYRIKETNELMGIGPKGSIEFEDIEAAGNWFFAEGLLEGADAVTMSDLPDTVTIWDNDGAVRFEIFIDDDLVALNGQEVSAWLLPDYVNDIHWLKVVE